jgi:hypothetical protein
MTQFLPAALLLKVFSSGDGIHRKMAIYIDWGLGFPS